jgi:sodium/bile acid cotransporter 7
VDKQFFLVGVISAIGAAAAAPAIGGRSPLLALAVSWGAPCGIFFIAGINMPTGKLAAATARVRAHAAIQIFSMAVVPLLTLAACAPLSALGMLSPVVRDAFLVLSVLPTTVNMCVALSRTAGGDEALAVFNAVLGNLLGIFVTPFMLLLLLGRTGAVPIAAAMRSLALKVLLPLTVGQLLRRAPAVRDTASANKKTLSRSSESLLFLTVYVTFCSTFLRGFGLPTASLAAIGSLVLLLHLLTLGCAWLLSGALGSAVLPNGMPERIAFVYCSTQKTLALGLPLLRIIFAGRADLAILCTPLLIQHPLQLLVGSLLAPKLAALAEEEKKREA